MTEELEKKLYEAANANAFNIDVGDLNTNRDIFIDGAKWMEEQLEANRLKHCDELTPQEAQIESDFITEHFKSNNRIPTYIDAIKYGREETIDKACEWLRICNYTFPYKMIEEFRQAMEE